MEMTFKFKTEIDEKNYNNNLKHLGEVYAVITNKGYAIAQIGGLDRHGIPICRIFSDLYNEIPQNIEKIIFKKESYLTIISLHTMAHWKVKQAIKIGKYEIPSNFIIPKYYRNCFVFRKETGPFQYWSIQDYEGNIIYFKDFILNVLNKKITNESWKKEFLKLNSDSIFNGPALIEYLESGFKLDDWKPTDFKKKTKEIIKDEDA